MSDELSNPNEIEGSEANTEKTNDVLKTTGQTHIVQHGEGSHISIVTHKGEGNIDNSKNADLKLLRAEVKHLKKLLAEKDGCADNVSKEYKLIIESKDDEIKILKESLRLLEEELNLIKSAFN